jgi:hypothetical protein
VFTIAEGGDVVVDTYAVGNPEPLPRHAYSFDLPDTNAGTQTP